ncbi:glycosyltransferase family 2 protein [Vibrio breoganii]|uniref:glycosyltransferase family 2 protein n=1 Tax=Vibrio breoganii TaxID=553239 RepID=UPI000C83A466|nr:glycosyltransferase family 2 protein [Vibrio breoganii]PMJ49980.1 glycosyl transferase [Vibrio breoganii]PMK53498.1 glycosyl transferase [Vibrio breoganii]PMO26664.1 glycosyl transferase [Vibrio breoganii]PMO27777.1 glycosyl transferase [Vibrio breoganii]PMO69513.1 glycosyl transferase [Vibrio breoganii]
MSTYHALLIAVFVVASFLIVYHHVGYPLLLKFIAKRTVKKENTVSLRHFQKTAEDSERPTITVIIPAYNEEEWIADKIRNTASLDYPTQKLSVKIICDGCSDNTANVATATIQEAICADTLFEVIEHKQNRGKVAIINEAMESTRSDLTVLSDVTSLISIDALLIAESHFQNEQVGVVNGTYSLFDCGSEGEEKYWQYQSSIKSAEANLATSIGSHGAFYVFRSHLFQPLASNSINDDFILPMRIVQKGYLADYDTNVITTEMQPTQLSDDFARRLRISAGNMQQAITLFGLFHPRFKAIAFAFFSGKGLRLLMPYLMLATLVSSALLQQYAVFQIAFYLQLAIYATSLVCWVCPPLLTFKPFGLIHYILLGHTANLIGGLRYLVIKNSH